jgi:hypothetical protein
MQGIFTSGEYSFVYDGRSFGCFRPNIQAKDFAERLKASKRLPRTLGSAPISSWLLARLAYLTCGQAASEEGDVSRNDGGFYEIRFAVRSWLKAISIT